MIVDAVCHFDPAVLAFATMLFSLNNDVLLHLMSYLPDAESMQDSFSHTWKQIHGLTMMADNVSNAEQCKDGNL